MKYAQVRVSSSAALAAGGELPKRRRILALGENPNSQGKRVFVGGKLAMTLAAPAYPFKEAPVDYEHNTVPGTPAYEASKEPRDIAGYCRISLAADGVYADFFDWTESGKKNALNFRDLSAFVALDDAGEVIAVPSVALTRTGSVPGITFNDSLAASAWPGVDFAALSALANPKPTQKTMDHKQTLIGLLVAFGLLSDANADDAAVTAALEKAKALKPPTADPATPPAAALSAELAKMFANQDAKFATLSALFTADQKQRVIDDAKRDGKVVALSAEIIDVIALEDLRKHCEGLPVTVPLSARTPRSVQEPASDPNAEWLKNYNAAGTAEERAKIAAAALNG